MKIPKKLWKISEVDKILEEICSPDFCRAFNLISRYEEFISGNLSRFFYLNIKQMGTKNFKINYGHARGNFSQIERIEYLDKLKIEQKKDLNETVLQINIMPMIQRAYEEGLWVEILFNVMSGEKEMVVSGDLSWSKTFRVNYIQGNWKAIEKYIRDYYFRAHSKVYNCSGFMTFNEDENFPDIIFCAKKTVNNSD